MCNSENPTNVEDFKCHHLLHSGCVTLIEATSNLREQESLTWGTHLDITANKI